MDALGLNLGLLLEQMFFYNFACGVANYFIDRSCTEKVKRHPACRMGSSYLYCPRFRFPGLLDHQTHAGAAAELGNDFEALFVKVFVEGEGGFDPQTAHRFKAAAINQ